MTDDTAANEISTQIGQQLAQAREAKIAKTIAKQAGILPEEVPYLPQLDQRLAIIRCNDGSDRVVFDGEWLFDFLPVEYRLEGGFFKATQPVRAPVPSPDASRYLTQ